MKTTIRFEHVSKRYQLGLTRTSLPSFISGSLKRLFERKPDQGPTNKYLWSLRDVSFELKEGESLALIGANGAGKTTILKLLANITKPTSGSIFTDGRLSALIELGAGFHGDLTGRENIFLNGTILGLNRKQISAHFDEIVTFSELERFIDTPVKRYSSGMAVRLGFAVASCINPEILLVDEVLAVGDASFQQKCLQRINTLISNGTSILFVSHNFYLVQAVCPIALYLEKGQTKLLGTTKDVINRYEEDLNEVRVRKYSLPDQMNLDGEASHLEITKVEVKNQNASPDIFSNSKPAEILIHYNAYQDLGRVQVSVFIRRSDGLTCCSMRTKADDFELLLRSGRGIVTLILEPLQLVTGTYYVEAWFLNQSDSMAITTKAGRSDWFSVKGNRLSYDNNSGVFEPKTRWDHQAVPLVRPGVDPFMDQQFDLNFEK